MAAISFLAKYRSARRAVKATMTEDATFRETHGQEMFSLRVRRRPIFAIWCLGLNQQCSHAFADLITACDN